MTTDISFYFFSFLGVLFLAALVYLFLFLTKLQRREEVNYSLQLALLLVVVPLHRKDKAVGDVEGVRLEIRSSAATTSLVVPSAARDRISKALDIARDVHRVVGATYARGQVAEEAAPDA